MTSLLDHAQLIVKQRPGLPSGLTSTFDIYDEHGRELGTMVQVAVNEWARDRRDKKDWAIRPFELRALSGEVVLELRHKRALKSSLAVSRPGGVELGHIRQEKLIGKMRFGLEAGLTRVGEVKADNLRNKHFLVVDAGGSALGRIDMTYGTSGDFEDTNDYEVRVSQPLADPLRSLVVASVFAVDIIGWERHAIHPAE